MTNEERQKANVIGPWVAKLALATSAGQEKMTKERLFLYVQLLASEFPVAAFTDASLKSIVAGTEYFPAWAVLKTGLDAWLEANRPKALAPPISEKLRTSLQEHLDEMEDNADNKARRADRLQAAKEDWSDPDKIRASLLKLDETTPYWKARLGRFLGQLVRKHAPENLGYLPPEFHPPPSP